MRRVTVAACAALCLMGTSSLALAEEGAKYGDQMKTGKLSKEPGVLGMNDEPVRADDAMSGKREPVQGYDATGQGHDAMTSTEKENKAKTKTHRDAAKAAPAAKP
ncbi:MAG: hypothetical protein ABI988_09285 [Nitrospirota bacterium]